MGTRKLLSDGRNARYLPAWVMDPSQLGRSSGSLLSSGKPWTVLAQMLSSVSHCRVPGRSKHGVNDIYPDCCAMENGDECGTWSWRSKHFLGLDLADSSNQQSDRGQQKQV